MQKFSTGAAILAASLGLGSLAIPNRAAFASNTDVPKASGQNYTAAQIDSLFLPEVRRLLGGDRAARFQILDANQESYLTISVAPATKSIELSVVTKLKGGNNFYRRSQYSATGEFNPNFDLEGTMTSEIGLVECSECSESPEPSVEKSVVLKPLGPKIRIRF